MSDFVQYETPVYCNPSFPVIFHEDEMNEKRPAVYTNWHKGIEVLWCIGGAGKVTCNMEIRRFTKGDFVVIHSQALHSLCVEGKECHYYCLIVEPQLLKPPDCLRRKS